MKKFLILSAAYVLMSGLQCSKEDLKIKFPIDAATFTFDVPASPTTGPINFAAHNLSYNLDSLCKANSCNLEQIQSVKLISATFTIEDPDPATTFNMVDWAEGYIESAPVLPQVLIASKNPMPKTGLREVSLDVPDLELVDYVKRQTVSCFAKGNINTPVTHNIPVRCKVKFEVTALISN